MRAGLNLKQNMKIKTKCWYNVNPIPVIKRFSLELQLIAYDDNKEALSAIKFIFNPMEHAIFLQKKNHFYIFDIENAASC